MVANIGIRLNSPYSNTNMKRIISMVASTGNETGFNVANRRNERSKFTRQSVNFKFRPLFKTSKLSRSYTECVDALLV